MFDVFSHISKFFWRTPRRRSRFVTLSLLLIFIAAFASTTLATTFNDPLVDAADLGNIEQVTKLLKGGTPVDNRGDFGTTALMRASFRGNTELIQLLLESGAYVNASDVGGETALHLAAKNGHADAVKELLYYDAFVDAPDKEQWTPLMRATLSKQADVVKILLDKGADVNAVNNIGESVLVHAAIAGVPDITEMIVGNPKADKIPKAQENIAVNLARRKNHNDVEKVITTYMATEGRVPQISEASNSKAGGMPQSEDDNPFASQMPGNHVLPLPSTQQPRIPVTYSNSSFYVQLGTFNDPQSAEQSWSKITQPNGDVLARLSPSVVKSTIGTSNNDAIYRLRAGILPTKPDADNACRTLRERGVECFVIEVANSAENDTVAKTIPLSPAPLSEASNNPYGQAPGNYPKLSDNNIQAQTGINHAPQSAMDYNANEQALPWHTNTAIPAQPGTPYPGQPYSQNPAELAPTLSNNDFMANRNSIRNNTQDTYQAKQFVQDNIRSKQEYDDFYNKVKNGNEAPVSEAVLVPNESYFSNGRQTDVADPGKNYTTNGIWINISNFPNESYANDYGIRMFRNDASLGNVQILVGPGEVPSTASMHVGPLNSTKANNLCNTVIAGGFSCVVTNNGTATGSSSYASNTVASEQKKYRPQQNNQFRENAPILPNKQLAAPVPLTTEGGSAASYWINLGTFANSSEAEYYWMFVKEDNGDILGKLKYEMPNAPEFGEFGDSAVQLRTGPFIVKQRASQICNIMRFRNIACLVTQ